MGNDAHNARRSMRPDARLLAWDDLTEQQRECLEGAFRLLAGRVEKIEPEPRKIPGARSGLLHLVRIDPSRDSSVLLIDGARGSGKTTVLLKLLDLCGQMLRDEKIEEALRGNPALETLRGRLLSTNILDLQPLAQDVSLVMWIASQLHEVIDAIETDTRPHRALDRARVHAPWEPDASVESESRRAWRRFVEVIAGGWSGNLAERKGQLDPEAWALELERAEQDRAHLQQRWRDLVDALLKAAHDAHPTRIADKAHLLIPIDDADMNPQRCVELLELVRVLWHPRVMFVLTGETGLFLTTLRLHVEGVFADVARRATVSDDGRRQATVKAAELHGAIYDKAIPEGHRLLLEPIEAFRRMELVKEALNKVVVVDNNDLGHVSLATYLERNKSLAGALPPYPRGLQDVVSLAGSRTAAELAFWIWSEACREARVSPSDDLRVELREKVLHVAFRGVSARLENVLIADSGTAMFCSRLRVEGLVDLKTIMPDRVLRAFLLCANVAGDHGRGSGLSGWIAFAFSNEAPAFAAGIVSEGGSENRFSWPHPPWRAFADHETFSMIWEKALESLGSSPTVDAAANAFIRACIATGSAKRSEVPVVDVSDSAEAWAVTLEMLEQAMTNQPVTSRQWAAQAWARADVLLLAAPESGLSAARANELLRLNMKVTNHVLRKDFDVLGEGLLSRRLRRARAGLADPRIDASELLQRIDNARRGFLWRELVLDGNNLLRKRLRQKLEKLALPHDDNVALVAEDLDLFHVLSSEHTRHRDIVERLLSLTLPTDTREAISILWKTVVESRFSTGGPTRERLISMVAVEDGRLKSRVGYKDVSQQVLRSKTFQRYVSHGDTRRYVQAPVDREGALWTWVRDTIPRKEAVGFEELQLAVLALGREVARVLDAEVVTVEKRGNFKPFEWIRKAVDDILDVRFWGPAWPTLRDELLCFRTWRNAADTCFQQGRSEIAEAEYEAAVGAWIESILRVWRGERTPFVMTDKSDGNYWSRLGVQVFELGVPKRRSMTPSQTAISHWCRVAAPLLAAPEGPLHASNADAFLEGLMLQPKNLEAIRAVRRKFFASLPSRSPSDDGANERLLARINEQNASHPWFKFFGPKP